MAPEFERRFVEAPGRLVHYARGGIGPAVVMLHGSPQSHAALLRLGRVLAAGFTVFALDTPGYGASDPLPPGAGMDAFADALAATLRALGLGPVPVYGTHTGADIALVAANRHPDLVSRAVLDGVSLFTAAEQAALLGHHLPPLQTAWDGSHMTALWSRVRDQAVFFPWYDRAARRTGDPASLAATHQAALDLLHAGPNYAGAYAASIALGPEAMLVAPGRVRVFCRTNDVLAGHLARIPPGGPQARAIDPGDDHAIIDALAEAPSCRAPHAAQPRGRRIEGGIHVRVMGSGPPMLLLHDLPGSSRTALDMVRALSAARAVIAPDLPGWGLSDAMPGQDDPGTAARLVAAAVDVRGPLDVVGIGVGALLAPAVARHIEAGRVAAVAPPVPLHAGFAEAYMVDAAPRWDGGHMVAAWFRQRDALLFRPWFDRRAVAAVPLGAVDLDALQDRVTAMLEARGPDLTRALLGPPAAGDPCRSFPAGLPASLIEWLTQPARSAIPCV